MSAYLRIRHFLEGGSPDPKDSPLDPPLIHNDRLWAGWVSYKPRIGNVDPGNQGMLSITCYKDLFYSFSVFYIIMPLAVDKVNEHGLNNTECSACLAKKM